MRKRICAVVICIALLIMGCGAGTPDSAASEEAQSKAKTEETAESPEEAEEKADSEEDAAEAVSDAEDGSDEQEEAVTEETKTEENASDAEESGEADPEAAGEDSAKTDQEEAAKETAEEETSGAPAAAVTEKVDKKQQSAEKYPNDYIPEGFSPYGNYVLVYDSGYEVKTRLSEAGLTYYYGSEEFLFTLNKDLPDMTREVAHILFNTTAPMDPADTEGEEFPFGEGFVIYISLDNGSYYEVSSYSMDLGGRVFARDIFELFRVKWQDAF